jgi:MFS family permease
MLTLVPDGPYITRSNTFNGKIIFTIFKQKEVKAAAFGYFGHMWELYTFWAFLPFMLSTYSLNNPGSTFNIALWVFIIIASGSIGCGVGGVISKTTGSAKIAFFQLTVSGCCCMLSPLTFGLTPALFIGVMTLWGITAAGDSPQYSTVIALKTSPNIVGSTLTLVNSIGFFITIVSIQLVDYLSSLIAPQMLFLILLPGPLFGLYSMRKLVRPTT